MKTTRLSILPSLTIFLISFTLLCATAAQAQVPSYVPTNGLVGYWPFNGNANDESGNGNNGTVNGATLAADRFGNANSAYEFNGINDYISFNSSSLIYGNLSRTISLWLRPYIHPSDYTLTGLSYGSPVYSNSYMVGFGVDNGQTVIAVQGWALDFGCSLNYNDFEDILITTIYDGVNSKIFVNGQFFCEGAHSLNTTDGGFFYVGTRTDAANSFFSGIIDEVGIWNRALTADEVLALYNGCNVSPLAVSGNVTPTQFTQETYTYPNTAGSTYNWTVTNGVIVSGQGTNTIDVMWANTGIGSVSVVETNSTTCTGDLVTYDVVVIPTNLEELSNALILYPNPVTTELNLQTTSDFIGTDLFVFDALGKQILKQQILSTNTIINTSSFAAGNYVVKVGEGVKKFSVEK